MTSRMAPISCYEKVFRWVEEYDREQCAVCFNTSELEEEVMKALLVCHVPTVLVVTGKFRNTYNVQIEQALKEDRLLILVLQREESDGKGFEARLRNQWVIGQVQNIACGSSFSASLSETATGSFLHICKQLLVVCLPSSLRQLRHSLVKKGAAEDESCGLHKNANGAAKGGIRW